MELKMHEQRPCVVQLRRKERYPNRPLIIPEKFRSHRVPCINVVLAAVVDVGLRDRLAAIDMRDNNSSPTPGGGVRAVASPHVRIDMFPTLPIVKAHSGR